MVNWELHPNEGIGPIHRGQRRDAVEAVVGPPDVERRWDAGDYAFAGDQPGSSALWGDGDVKVTFVGDSVFEVEVMEPSQVFYLGVPLLGRPVQDVGVDLLEQGMRIEPDGEGWVGDGFALWIDDAQGEVDGDMQTGITSTVVAPNSL